MTSMWNVRPADEGEVGLLAQKLGLPRAIARVLWLRGYKTPHDAQRFLASRNSLDYLQHPILSPGMEKAVRRLKQALSAGEKIVIYGDYDCDGVTSSTVLYRYLARGLKGNVEAYLPDRFKDGYGVTPAAVERLAAQGTRVILTCDNGISAHAAAAAAKAHGIDLIVTDHHQVPEELPDVHSIVHPQVDFNHLKDLAGVGVAYLLTIAMEGSFTPRMEHFLDFVTIGTVADMVPLNGPNRPLVWAGIERYRERYGNGARGAFPGVKALGAIAKTDFDTFTPQDIGFRFGPRLNAAGRLETPDIGFKLLTTNDEAEAYRFAHDLDAINVQRKELNAELEKEICDRLEREWDFDREPFVVLADESFHHGITGIVAGRIKERYRVPVLLFSGHGDGPWKASGRSPEGLHLYDALHAAQEHLLGFGGHAQAAGCSAMKESIPALREALNRYVREQGWTRPADVVWLDAELPFAEATEQLLQQLDDLEPFGQKNPAPVFGLLQARVVGKRTYKQHLFVQIDDGRTVVEIPLWGQADKANEYHGWVRLAYMPEINTYRGERSIAYRILRVERTAAPPPVEIAVPKAPAPVEDRRNGDPARILDALEPGRPVSVYANRLPSDPGLLTAMDRVKATIYLPQTPLPLGLGHLVCLDVPYDEEAWTTLRSRADVVTMAWPEREAIAPLPSLAPVDALDEGELSPRWLRRFYLALSEHRGEPLMEVAVRIAGGGGDGAISPTMGGNARPKGLSGAEGAMRAIAALRIFREAGILVERGEYWSLLTPPDWDIQLPHLTSFQAYKKARAFRERFARGAIVPV
ncbi:Single-stranded-DNA-specific exonuclease RecJ [compost metagenome]